MKLTFHGATRTTTGSKYILEINHKRILIECGMFQGRRAESLERNSRLPFDPASVDVMLLSHAHIDHSGIIPVLTRDGFEGRIYCTDATADLCTIMLQDSAHIQEQDAAFLSKKNQKKSLPPVHPLYTQTDALTSLDHFHPVPYDSPVPITDGVTATWLDAGHILGSAMVVFDLEENGRRCRFAFSGDIGRGRNDILRDPSLPEDVDYLMMETTYGNRDHENRDDVNARICEIINRTIERRGKIVIPAFAVGRTQQLLYTLYQLKQDGCIPELPIYVDSPLASKATETFNHHLECFNKGFSELMRRRDTPFNTGNVTYTGSVEESMRLNDLPGPCIILSASGMAEAGRIRHHIKNTVEDDRNTILIVGWCAPHTLGSHLASGHKEVNIFGEPHRVRADIRTIDAFSGHADRRELEEWAANLTGPLKGIYLIHGEELPARALGVALQKIHPAADIRVPDYLDSVQW